MSVPKKIVIGTATEAVRSLATVKPPKFAGITHPDNLVKNKEPYFGDGPVRMPNGGTYSGDWRDLLLPGREQTRQDAEAILASYERLGADATTADIQRDTELDGRRFRNAVKFLEKSGFTVREV